MPPGQQPTTTTTTTTTKTTTTTTTQQNQTGMMTNISSGNNVVQPVMAAQNVSQTQTNTYQHELARLKQELGEIKKPSVMMTQQFEAQVYSDSVGAEKRKKKSKVASEKTTQEVTAMPSTKSNNTYTNKSAQPSSKKVNTTNKPASQKKDSAIDFENVVE